MNAVSIPGSEELEVLSPSCIEIVQALHRVMFMQDGAPLHIAAPVQRLLRSAFGIDCVTSMDSQISRSDTLCLLVVRSFEEKSVPSLLPTLKDTI
ncbi:hypothetical protein AVEN_218011-1 [Araneus ventricosus]|uniref:Uncharacterized protein n=1 Tax=Araneus ventricosus TaxID=182803 RepID=A0A4Y2V9H0_ARAVE|nr:hypothetical protein AVEN_218011-1 [Araneus ventricosus]